MALALFDRVQETTTTTGTGSVTLAGAVPGFQSFAVVGNGNTCYYTIVDGSAWEVGTGTYSTSGPTLARTTVLSNSNGNTSPITLAAGTKSVFLTYPAGKSVNLNESGNVSPLGTVSSGVWQGSTVGVAYGGTGVTASSGANSVVLRDSNQNIAVNRVNQSNTNTTAAGGTTALTAASSYIHTLVGTGNQTYTLPDATTLTTGVAFVFNNLATGTLTIANYAGTTVGTVPSGGAAAVFLTLNSTVGGTWDIHAYLPEGVTFGTNAFNLGTSIITGGTWNGGTIATGYGGTGLTSYTSGGAVYANSSSTLTSGTLPVTAGGTGNTTGNSATTSQTNFSNLTIGGSQVLYAGNYNSYAPTLTGGGASGTWGINISGNAATATTAANYVPLAGGTMSGNLTVTRILGVNSLILNTYTTVNPSSNVYLYSQPNDRDSWIFLDSADTGSNWGIYHRQIDSTVSGLPGNSIGFIGGGTSALQAWISLANGSANFAGALTQGGNQVLHAGNYNSYAPTLTGTGATGTWGINVTGTSGSISGFNNPTTAATANTIAYRDGAGDIAVRELVMTVGVQDFTPSSLVAIYPTTNQAVKVTAGGARNFLDVPTRSGGNASGTWGINITGSAGSAGTATTATNLSGGTVAATTGSFSGALTLNGPMGNSTTPPLVLSPSSSSGTFQWASTAISASLGVGQTMIHIIGNAASAGNSGYVGFNYTSAASGSNYVSLGLFANDNILRVYYNTYTESSGSMRAPLFYDSNDTAYFVDPNSSSFLNSVGVATGGIKMNRAYTSNTIWFNAGTDTNHALWNAYNGNDPVTRGGAGSGFDGMLWNAYAGIQIRGGPAGSFNLITATPVTGTGDVNSHVIGLYGYNALQLATANGYAYAPNDFRAPIFYDSNNTAYYCDPNSVSRLDVVRSNVLQFIGSDAYAFGNYWAGTAGYPGYQFIGGNSRFGFSSTSGYIDVYTDGNYYGGIDQSGANRLVPLFDYNQGGGALYSSILYDTNNTGYYCDPSGTSNLVTGIFNSGATFYNDGSSRAMYIRGSGNIIQFADADGTFRWEIVGRNGEFYVYKGYGTGTGYKWQIDNSGNHIFTGIVSLNTDIRSPIYYDSNNTGYYLDPNSSGKALLVNGNIECTARSESWAEGIRVNVPSAGTWGGIRFTRGASTGNWAIGFTGLNSTDDLTFYGGTNNLIQLNLDQSGNLIARGNVTAYGSPSDRRLKENIQPVTGALDKIMRLQGCTFSWKEDSREYTMAELRDDMGFIADDVQEILPAMVRRGGDGYLSLRDRGFSALLVEAMKEQQAQIAALRAEVNALRAH